MLSRSWEVVAQGQPHRAVTDLDRLLKRALDLACALLLLVLVLAPPAGRRARGPRDVAGARSSSASSGWDGVRPLS